jgi:3-oxoadipate enol-lactonase
MNSKNGIETGFAEVNGARLYYEITGEGHPFVLNHSFLTDKSSWDDQFSVFAQHYKMMRYDLRGFGSSSVITEPYSPTEDLYALLKFLGIEKTYLLGLSGSGSIAIDFTLEHPEMVDALIAVSSGLNGYQSPVEASGEWPLQWKEFIEARQQGDNPRAAEAMLSYWIDGSKRPSQQVNPVLRERVRETLIHNYSLANDPNSWDMAQPLKPSAITQLSTIHIPTLIIVGDKDDDDTLATANILSTEIKSARKVVIPNTTHHPNMEKPTEFNRAVLDLLSLLA